VVPSLADALRALPPPRPPPPRAAGDDATQGLRQLRYAPSPTPIPASQFSHPPRTLTSVPISLLLPDSRSKWRKRKRAANPSPSRQPGDNSDDSDSAGAANGAGDDDGPRAASANGGGGTLARADCSGGGDDDLTLDLREAEVLSSAEPISAFPVAVRRVVGRPHPSVLAVIAAERTAAGASGALAALALVPTLENISHGQLQVLSAMLRDHPSLSNDPDKPSTYVCTPPPLMEGRGVHKQFYGKLHIIPRHSGIFLSR
jgi:SWI/SNF related-matrix-associated actin-dependent regulator of chromatin subfamily C